jgi:hypothetical protein
MHELDRCANVAHGSETTRVRMRQDRDAQIGRIGELRGGGARLELPDPLMAPWHTLGVQTKEKLGSGLAA